MLSKAGKLQQQQFRKIQQAFSARDEVERDSPQQTPLGVILTI